MLVAQTEMVIYQYGAANLIKESKTNRNIEAHYIHAETTQQQSTCADSLDSFFAVELITN